MLKAIQPRTDPGSNPVTETDTEGRSPGIAKVRQIPPRLEQSLLRGVPSELGIPKDPVGDAIETIDLAACELAEGLLVTHARSLHERSHHRRPSIWQPHGLHR